MGAYFGHSVAVLDANGDGLDDIAIGAPLHSNPMDKYETGRVYVVYQNEAVSPLQKKLENYSQHGCLKQGCSNRPAQPAHGLAWILR